MPKVSTIADIAAMDPDDPIKAIRGTILKVHKPFAGGEGKKAYHFQTVEFTDGVGNINLKLSGRPELGKDWEGIETYVCCINGSHGWTGVKVKDESYKNKKQESVNERVVWVTSTAEFIAPDEFDADGGNGDLPSESEQAADAHAGVVHRPQPSQRAVAAPSRQAPAPAQRQAPRQQPARSSAPAQRSAAPPHGAPQSPPAGAAPKEDLKAVRLFFGQTSNAYQLALRAAIHTVKATYRGLGLIPAFVDDQTEAEITMNIIADNRAEIFGVASTFFIQSAKTGHLFKMPSGVMEDAQGK